MTVSYILLMTYLIRLKMNHSRDRIGVMMMQMKVRMIMRISQMNFRIDMGSGNHLSVASVSPPMEY